MDVTVVIATYNRPDLLRRAIQGVLSQEYDYDIEILIVHDKCEPDYKLEELSTFNRTIRCLSNQRTSGLAGSRNTGIMKATFDWIAFCDDDDEWLPNKLTAQLAALVESPEASTITTGITIRHDGEDHIRIPIPELLTHEGFLNDRMTEVHPSSLLIKKETLEKVGMVDEELPGGYAEDYDLLLRLIQEGTLATTTSSQVIVHWHGASFFFEKWQMIDDALDYLMEKHDFSSSPLGTSRILGQRAVAQAAMGKRKDALRILIKIVKLNKTEKRIPVVLLITLGVPAEKLLALAHKFGKGI